MTLRALDSVILWIICLAVLCMSGCFGDNPEPGKTAKSVAVTPAAKTISEPMYRLGETVSFSGDRGSAYLGKGWSGPEPGGRWSEGKRSELHFVLSDTPRDGSCQMVLKCDVFPKDEYGKQKVTVELNKTVLCEIGPVLPTGGVVGLTIDSKLLARDNTLVFLVEKPMSPEEAGVKEPVDRRPIGIMIKELQIKER